MRFPVGAGNDGTRTEIHNPALLNLQPGILQHAGFALCGALHAENAFGLDACQQAYVIDKTHS